MDRDLVKQAGLPFKSIFTGKLRRYFSWRNFTDPFLVLAGFFQAFFLVAHFKPHAVFTNGGFVSVPVTLAAFVLRRPVVLFVSDSSLSLSARIISHFARKICLAFSDTLPPGPRVKHTGNPVRVSLKHGDPQEGYSLTGLAPGKPVLLVWGGSLGAQQINHLLADNFNALKHVFQVVHVTGEGKQIPISDPHYKAFSYLNEHQLKHIYAITDVVLSRAGANTLFELAYVGKPNVLVPLTSAHTHQVKNALYFEKMGASIVLHPGDDLVELLTALWNNPLKRSQMQEALQSVASPHAARTMAQIILNV